MNHQLGLLGLILTVTCLISIVFKETPLYRTKAATHWPLMEKYIIMSLVVLMPLAIVLLIQQGIST